MESPTAELEESLTGGNKSADLEEPEADSQRGADDASSKSPAHSAGTESPVQDYECVSKLVRCVYFKIFQNVYVVQHMQVDLVKNRTILNGLTADMWTEEHDSLITKFITDPTEQLLLIYIDEQNGLTVCSVLPPYNVEEVMFFARDENAQVTPTNFPRVVQFGTIHGSYVDSLLRTMHNLYAPTFFENTSWPDSILHNVETTHLYFQVGPLEVCI